MTHIIDNQQLIDYPMNILEFQKMFHSEMVCLKYLEQMRWPNGFECSKCSKVSEPFRTIKRTRVLKCRVCHYESSITAGTVMHRSRPTVYVEPVL